MKGVITERQGYSHTPGMVGEDHDFLAEAAIGWECLAQRTKRKPIVGSASDQAIQYKGSHVHEKSKQVALVAISICSKIHSPWAISARDPTSCRGSAILKPLRHSSECHNLFVYQLKKSCGIGLYRLQEKKTQEYPFSLLLQCSWWDVITRM